MTFIDISAVRAEFSVKFYTAHKQWLPVVVTSSTCSNPVHLQDCILISAPADLLCSEPSRTTGNG